MSGTPPINRAQRYDTTFAGRLEPLDREAEGSPAVDVSVVDLSASGAGITCPAALTDGSRWRLHVALEHGEDFTETVVVRYCIEEGGGYRCGVQFVSAAALFAEAGIGLDTAIQDLGRAHGPEDKTADTTISTGALLRLDDDLIVEHIANLRVTSRNRLTVKADMVGCEAQLSGPLEVRGHIVGGRITTSNTVEVAKLGQAETPTRLVLGSLPETDALVAKVPKQLETFDAQLVDKKKELAYIENHGNEIGHNARERVMELEYEVEEIRGKRELLQAKFDELLNLYRKKVEINLRVHNAIEPGVVIEYLNQRYQTTRAIPGPLNISCAEDYTLKIAIANQQEQPLAEVMKKPATAHLADSPSQ